MQTTLLGLAVALILALVAALVGPHFVDWNRYRSDFETEASRLVGAPVRISGPIEARLLPVPSLALHSVEISAGESAVSARALQFELALGPLMRRQWRVNELTVSEPRFRIALDSAGNLKGPPVKAEIESDRLSIDKLVIEGGRVVLADEFDPLGFEPERFLFRRRDAIAHRTAPGGGLFYRVRRPVSFPSVVRTATMTAA